jgi:biopolymer transport protein ExbB/TolQ
VLWLFIPLIVVGVVLVLFLLLVVLGRFRNGALLRPVIASLSRIGFMRRFFTRISTAAIERQNPELARALKKINPAASNPNPQAVQKAMSRLTPSERRAYMEAAQEQGGVPESANRQMRRQAERMQQQARGGRPGGGGASSRKRKRK